MGASIPVPGIVGGETGLVENRYYGTPIMDRATLDPPVSVMHQPTPSDPPLMSADRVAERVRRHVAEQRGLSLVRIGDGEGVVLSRLNRPEPILDSYLTTHFGTQVDTSRLDDLAIRLQAALAGADVIGIRPDVRAPRFPADLDDMPPQALLEWAREHLALRPEERSRLDVESAVRLVTLGRWMRHFAWPETALLTSAWIHFDWLESGFLADLALGQERIGLVTGRPELASGFRSLGIAVDHWPVPLRFLRRDPGWTPHFPDRFDELVDTLEPAFPGQLFLVGAGICGKVYCDVIARRGGIALDIGAVCDAWLGISTRPRVARFRWGRDEVSERLLLGNQLHAARRAQEAGSHDPG